MKNHQNLACMSLKNLISLKVIGSVIKKPQRGKERGIKGCYEISHLQKKQMNFRVVKKVKELILFSAERFDFVDFRADALKSLNNEMS